MNRSILLSTGLGILLAAAPVFALADAIKGQAYTSLLLANEPVLNKANLDRVKRHILAAGKRCTYSNMYNNNPCWMLPEFNLYLNPDPGPDGHPQWNINCDVTRGDFNTLIVQSKSDNSSYRYSGINFQQAQNISVRKPEGATPNDISKIKDTLRSAVRAALATIILNGEPQQPDKDSLQKRP